MSDKHFTVNYGKGVTVFPEKAVDKMISGEATLTEIKTLSLILSSGGKMTVEEIAAKAELSPQDVENSISFWRGAGIISIKEGKPHSAPEVKTEAVTPKATETATANNTENAIPPKSDAHSVESAPRKALLSAEMPKYSGQEISDMLSKDGGRLKSMLDECQQLIGHIFNPRETETLIGICDWLGVDTDFVITLTAYYTRKKPGCKVGYIQKAALDLVNKGIDTIDLLDDHLRHMEMFDGLMGKLRTWLGIGAREYTPSEKSKIMHWSKDLGYGEDIIKYAYDVTVENTLSFNFKYANTVLENWYHDGVKTLADAEAREQAFKDGKAAEKSGTAKSSFDTDEFFNLAVRRSYEKMSGATDKKDN